MEVRKRPIFLMPLKVVWSWEVIAYPSAGSILSGRPVEICLDTLQRQFDARSKLLLESLGKYETKLGNPKK